ncbi:AAA family ATPase [Bacillaceae bacterium Marseille-Q3522]|nr:AAA family ATPase [Bacillaceae bacterium Marseille-Q3522]
MNSTNNMKQWKQEISENGYVTDFEMLLRTIQALDEKKDAVQLSDLFVYAALTRAKHKNNLEDPVVLTWMEKAQLLNPDNVQANEFVAQFEWRQHKDLCEHLILPPIRETDNRPAKQKAAEQLIHHCSEFLAIAEEHEAKIKKSHAYAVKFQQQTLLETYEEIVFLLGELSKEVLHLRETAVAYEQSMKGVFYNISQYEELKKSIQQINLLKNRWEKLFTDKNHTVQIEEDELSLNVLNKMIGLEKVKARVNDYYRYLKYQKIRKSYGFQTKDSLSLNMILTGNPGTGKTTLARLLAKIYHELDVLPGSEVIEADRSQLIGAYVGQTEENVRAIVQRSLGGVLFIDEAYSLKREGQSGNDFGQTAIDTLVSLMTGKDYGGKFAVILAGYPEEMRLFLDANPGLRSRFPQSNYLQLPDYTNDELIQIAEKLAAENDYIFTEAGRRELNSRLEKERVDNTFGNARTAHHIVLDAIFKKGSQVSEKDNILTYTLLEKEDFQLAKIKSNVNPKEKLQQLIGLENIKEDVRTLVSFVKMQQLRKEQHLATLPLQLHAVFSGNPGTGKTTVAKIYAELLKECGVLKRGHLLVTSRSDFVAGYVGQTAIKTKKKIREALGGVLFIDEAYSLLAESQGDFAKEVINTLVDEMTKHDENLVVILAGYPQEMNQLLHSNPGLVSRFKKFFNFPDYTTEELLAIMRFYAEKYQYVISNDAMAFLQKKLAEMDTKSNGRFATNVIDAVIQAQSLRIVEEGEANADLSLLTKVDFTKAMSRNFE